MEDAQVLQAILNSISEGVMALDREWRIFSWNSAAERITGFHREEVLGKECSKIFRTPLCRENCPVDKALSCGHPCRDVEVMVRNKNNQIVRLLVNATPLYDPNGVIIGGLETFRDISQSRWMEEELESHYGYRTIVGRSQAIQKVFETMARLLDTDTTVLIQGESGTGKELIARALHFYGSRKNRSFVAINCSALPEGILESELFGHVKGAFTGAIRDHVGKLELANEGTLFLDEIAEISPSIQVKLLRVLEEREFQRVGDNRVIRISARIITATNKDLYKRVLDGDFRNDLYYRLSVFPIHLPPLRERQEDIPLLVSHFIQKYNTQMGKSIQGITEKVLELLETYQWPGNIRELANAVEHAFVHAKGALIHSRDLPQTIMNPSLSPTPKTSTREKALDHLERQLIVKELEAAEWNKAAAAKRLHMSRATLWRKMQKYGINR